MEGQDTCAGKRIQSLDEFGDDTAYKNFRFRTAELHTIVDRLKVNGSKYTKLGAVLNILSRYGTAGTNHSRKQLMGLHDKRLSELHRHTAELLYAQHAKAVIPWLGPEFSCRKRLKSTPRHNPVYNPEIRFDFPCK